MEGSSRTTARLLYRALSIEPTHVKSLTCLVQWIMESGQQQNLRAMLAAPIIAYLSQPNVEISSEDKEYFTTVRTLCLHQWGFSQHKTHGNSARMGDYSNPSLFDIDEDRFAQFVSQTVEQAGSIETAMAAARTIAGRSGNALIKEGEKNDFQPSPEYQSWLESSEEILPKLRPMSNQKESPQEDQAGGNSFGFFLILLIIAVVLVTGVILVMLMM